MYFPYMCTTVILKRIANFRSRITVIVKFKILILILLIVSNAKLYPQEILDDFGPADGWNIYKADGVDLEISPAEGFTGEGIKLKYDFTKGTGYGGIQKLFPVDLPENFQFTFYLKAESPDNNFEFKLIDKSGENVWWVNNRNFKFPEEWVKIKIKKRHISFAWGPAEDKSLKRIDRIEFTVASFAGGTGTVYIDELSLQELPPEDNSPVIPSVSASSEHGKNYSVRNINDQDINTQWKSSEDEKQEMVLFLAKRRELGGLVIDWDRENFAEDFDVYLSEGKKNWNKVYSVRGAKGYRSYIRLKEEDALSIKIELLKSSSGKGYGIREISIKNVDFSADINRFFINVAAGSPRGYFPRYFYEEGSFWTVSGVSSDTKEALINEDGMVEVDKKQFSIEPFLRMDGKLITWNDVHKEQSLEKDYLPVPSVRWNYKDFILEIKIFSAGEADKNSVLYLIYKLKNNSSGRKKGILSLAVRPFQVNPYYQWLNITGGAGGISSIKYNEGIITVNDEKVIIPVTKEDSFGAVSFDEGNIVSFISDSIYTPGKNVKDPAGFASGMLNYSFDLNQNEEKIIYAAVPFHGMDLPPDVSAEEIENLLKKTITFWEEKTNQVKFNLPESAQKIINVYRSNLAYILINMDGEGIQPGSRSYERSWIRDGSLTSSALLKSGIQKEVREFIDWYSARQYENGKVPCVVDSRGPDPVPENDSHGQLIFLIKQYFNFTKDTAFLASKNENVIGAVNYLKELIARRSADQYKKDTLKPYFGILPESISHEGYSAKPMHSYWDNFFAMKGLKDAAEIQRILQKEELYKDYASVRDEFRKNLYNSISLAVKKENIDYIPGCVELGDFDATSTTIAIDPCNEFENLPRPYAENTFDRYYSYFEKRKDPAYEWDGYTPYEVRTFGSFIFLDEPKKAHSLIDYFLKHQRPQGWNHWAEVVWKDERKAQFIGDMPHTWVGSDFINAFRSMFVYENDSLLVIGAGLKEEWIDSEEGISVEQLPTYYGLLSYSIKKEKGRYILNIYGDIKLPAGNIILKNFKPYAFPTRVIINKKESENYNGGSIIINQVPAEVEIFY